MTLRLIPTLLTTLLATQLSGCLVGPDYVKPKAVMSDNFKELRNWKPAQPRDNIVAGKWWEIFKDAKLNELENQVAKANQSIIQAEAQYRQAQHLVQSVQSSLFPTATLNGTFNRFLSASGQSVAVSGVRNLFGTAVGAAWQPDLWGSIRRQIESNTGNAQASAATLQALHLSIQATLAQNYFQLKVLDAQKLLFAQSLEAYNKTLAITQNRYDAGVAALSDVKQAEAQLQALQAQEINLGIQRAKLEHAIALLIGKPPSALSLQAAPLDAQPPNIPVVLPSELLERRPDIAAAERKVAAANAQIGVAKAAYYPSFNLAANNGFQSNTIDTLFTMARRYWALGPAGAALTIFDGGAKNAAYKQAIDNFDASVAAYRQTVLTSFQEVEDNIAALRILEEETQVQAKAVAAADQALTLTMNQYQAGTISYLNVLTANTNALNNRQTAVQLQGQQLAAAVLLVKALGGGWNLRMLPSKDEAGGEVQWTDYLILPMS